MTASSRVLTPHSFLWWDAGNVFFFFFKSLKVFYDGGPPDMPRSRWLYEKGLMASTWMEQIFAGFSKWRLGVGMALNKKRRKVVFGGWGHTLGCSMATKQMANITRVQRFILYVTVSEGVFFLAFSKLFQTSVYFSTLLQHPTLSQRCPTGLGSLLLGGIWLIIMVM